MDITITIPKTVAKETLEEYEIAKKEKKDLYFRTPSIPKQLSKLRRVFVIVNNQIIGHHKFKRVSQSDHDWACEITGREWPAGTYLVRNGASWRRLEHPIPAKSHRGYRYAHIRLHGDNHYRRYRKKPIVVRAKQMEKPFMVKTLEGTMKGKAWDFLIIGVNGEHYPCDKEIFLKTYEEV